MKTDIEIAQSVTMKKIDDIAVEIGVSSEELEHYGKYKAKLPLTIKDCDAPNGKLVLVTAITPTPAG